MNSKLIFLFQATFSRSLGFPQIPGKRRSVLFGATREQATAAGGPGFEIGRSLAGILPFTETRLKGKFICVLFKRMNTRMSSRVH
jgi:hypothetical protein